MVSLYVSQSTIKMDKGYYLLFLIATINSDVVAIHNKNGQGLLLAIGVVALIIKIIVAIHNKNGQGLLRI